MKRTRTQRSQTPRTAQWAELRSVIASSWGGRKPWLERDPRELSVAVKVFCILTIYGYITFVKPTETYTLNRWTLLHINYTSIKKQKVYNLPQKRITARLQHRGVNATGKDMGGVRRWGILRRHRPAGPEAKDTGHLGAAGNHQEGWELEGTLGDPTEDGAESPLPKAMRSGIKSWRRQSHQANK